MRFTLFTLFLVSIVFTTLAQNRGKSYVDSLLNELEIADDIIDKIYITGDLAGAYNDIDVDSAIYFARRTLTLAGKVKDTDARQFAHNSAGIVYLILSDYDSALYCYEVALNENIKQKDSIGLANSYYNIAGVYSSQSQYATGMQYYLQALSIYESQNSEEDLPSLYTDIANVYAMVEEDKKADSFFHIALHLNSKIGDRYSRGYLLYCLASFQSAKERYDEALVNADSVIDIYSEIGNGFFVTFGKEIKAECYLGTNKYNEALRLYKEAEEFYITTNDEYSIAINKLAQADVYVSLLNDTTGYNYDKELFESTRSLNIEKAIDMLEEVKQTFEDNYDEVEVKRDIYELLSKAYEQKGSHATALEYYKLRSAMHDSITAQNETKKVSDLESRKQIEVKDKELELQNLLIAKKKNERWYLIGGIAFLVIVLIIIYRNYSERGKMNKLLNVEKHKSEELLHNILPEEVASELKERGATTAQHFDRVTVLFTDFVGFTKSGERMTSQELVDELHACFKAFDEITERYHIEKIKTIGDAYLAASGLPIADDSHARNVVNAAIDILNFMKQRQQKLGEKTFEIRIGVHSGDVVAGIVGVRKFAYDIWGDTVNTAARMEQNSEPNKINISQTTYELVKDNFNFTFRGELDAKNKGKLKMYFVNV